MRTNAGRLAARTGLTSLLLLSAVWTHSAPAADDKGSAPKAEVAKTGKKLSGRLPAHYGKVVDERQRQEIYKIQEEFRPKISKARETLDALVEEQKAKISAVLTPEQQKRVAEASGKSTKKEKEPGPPTKKPPASNAASPASGNAASGK